MTGALLELNAMRAGYGEMTILEDITLSLAPGECVSIVGRNGVGKTTLLAAIAGRARCQGGSMLFAGESLIGRPIHRRAVAGIGLVPQQREIFPSLTVAENLAVSARPGPWSMDRVYALFPRLAERRSNRGDQLSGGEQQMLAVARALVGNPSLLLLDEPSEGLAPVIVEILVQALATMRAEGRLTMLLVEQRLSLALSFAPRVAVMRGGRIVHDGPAKTLREDAGLLDRLLGLNGGGNIT